MDLRDGKWAALTFVLMVTIIILAVFLGKEREKCNTRIEYNEPSLKANVVSALEEESGYRQLDHEQGYIVNQDVVDTIIIGAGPTGLGAAWRLHQCDHMDWIMVDAATGPGGLSATLTTPEGFLFDQGGHVLFSHFPYFDQVCDIVLGADGWNTLQRAAYVRVGNVRVPYPFQLNIAALEEKERDACLQGVRELKESTTPPENFQEWILSNMGQGIADTFMLPYNRKVWNTEPSAMSVEWLGERVAKVDLKTLEVRVKNQEVHKGWGPNATFRFPQRGGTGSIYRAMAEYLPHHRQHYNSRVVRIDSAQHTVTMEDGRVITYRNLISTMPLPHLLALMGEKEEPRLTITPTFVVGLGIRGTPSTEMKDTCWEYFPDPDVPFYRATVFSNYSPHHVPAQGGPYWSLLLEQSGTAPSIDACIAACRKLGMLTASDVVVSRVTASLPCGYPVPTLQRQAALDEWIPRLDKLHIYSRGRFGGFKYEVANQDHSFMQGVEVADRVMSGRKEIVYFFPELVNARTANAALMTQLVGDCDMTPIGNVAMIVSFYNEDPTWIRALPAVWKRRLTVYLKDDTRDEKEFGDDVNVIRLPNVGREGHSYTYHIERHYHELADYQFFLQGDPFDHVPAMELFDELYRALQSRKRYTSLYKALISEPGKEEANWGVRKILGYSPATLSFHPCAMFGTTRAALQSRSRDWWRSIRDELSQSNDPICGHHLERCWGSLLS